MCLEILRPFALILSLIRALSIRKSNWRPVSMVVQSPFPFSFCINALATSASVCADASPSSSSVTFDYQIGLWANARCVKKARQKEHRGLVAIGSKSNRYGPMEEENTLQAKKRECFPTLRLYVPRIRSRTRKLQQTRQSKMDWRSG